MSVDAVSASPNLLQPPNGNAGSQFRQDFRDLTQAIDSGGLAGAQSAYATLAQMRPANGGNHAGDPGRTDLEAIGKALQSGDIQAAQDGLKKLQDDMKTFRTGPHGHHKSAADEIPAPTSDSDLLQSATIADDQNTSTTNGIVDITA
jgi:ABC-type Fe3+ transport system substrate-binding protein